MDLTNKIDAHITTIGIDFKNIDIEKQKNENETLMNIIRNMKFDGIEQPLFNDELDTVDI